MSLYSKPNDSNGRLFFSINYGLLVEINISTITLVDVHYSYANNLMKGTAMNAIDAWQQGHSDGVNLAVQQINKWCELDCKTLTEIINAINKLRNEVKQCSTHTSDS